MSKTRKHIKNDKGFTLVELMVTVLLTAIAVVSIYRGYTAFSQSADAQQQVMEMQQNLRIGMYTLASDIRRAGINKEDKKAAGFIYEFDSGAAPPIIDVCSNDLDDPVLAKLDLRAITFSMDLVAPGFDSDCKDNDDDGISDKDDSGPPECAFSADAATKALEEVEGAQELLIGDGKVDAAGEKIRYSLQASGDTFDLRRGVWNGVTYDTYTLITNVEALNFVYFNDEGLVLDPDVNIDPSACSCLDPTCVCVLSEDDAAEVDRVEITLVVRATNEDYRITNSESYPNLQAVDVYTAPGDNFRRRAATMSVQIRNNL